MNTHTLYTLFVWVGDVGPLGVNVEEGRGDTHRVPVSDHGEAGEVIRGQDMGDAEGGSHTRGSGNPVGDNLHRETKFNSGVVGGATSLI